ncbi:hypothetical protein [Brevundimonas naejangsanensis]|uniref:hypothetical protein n=1 Tax=Brevundimonas naejangsanensis TaxID=588932 RepID=UPI0013C4F329|nr:hypothetical protein [Brevundimonas naejangsanensis]
MLAIPQSPQCAISGHADHAVNATFGLRPERPLSGGIPTSQTDPLPTFRKQVMVRYGRHASPGSQLFLHDLRYDVGSLVVTLAVKGDPHFEVQFDPPRAFRSYAESDFWQYLKAYKGEPLLSGGDADVGVFMSEDASNIGNTCALRNLKQPTPA